MLNIFSYIKLIAIKAKKIPTPNSTINKEELFAILGACAFSLINIYFFFNYSPSFTTKNTAPIANIKYKKNEVKRKLSGSLNWTQPKSGELLYKGDEVFTGEESQAVIYLTKEGIRISLSANSLVQIEYTKQKPLIEIKRGEAEIINNKKIDLEIKTEFKTFEILAEDNSNFKVSTLGTLVDIKSTKGSIAVNKIQIPKNTLNTLDNKSDNFILKKLPEIRIPIENQIIYQEQNDIYPVFLKKKNYLNSNLLIEISTDQGFGKIISTQNINSLKPLNQLDQGSYYIRLRNKELISYPTSFSVSTHVRFVGLTPINGQTININRGEALHLNWNFYPGLFTKIILKNIQTNKVNIYETRNSDLAIIPKEEGSYSWKLDGVFKGQAIPQSQEFNFLLAFKPLPSLLSPIINKFPYLSKKIILFKWSNEVHDEFEFVISNKKTNQEIVKQPSSNSEYILETPQPGEYNFRLRSTNYRTIKESDLNFPFIVQSPLLIWKDIKKIELMDKNPEIKMPVKQLFTNEELYYDLSLEGKMLFEKQLFSLVKKIKLENDGNYCLKVYQKNTNDLFFMPEDLCFLYKYKPPFSEIAKASDQVLTMKKTDSSIYYKLKCPKVNRAKTYEFIVTKDPEGRLVVFKQTSSVNELDWKSNRSGIYFFQYRVYDSSDRMSPLSPISKIIFPISPLEDLP